jgi:Asp/Glu/hydantoin racemase
VKLVNIPPYQRAGINYDPALGHFAVRELIANMREKGQLEGIEIDIDDGYKTDHSAETRDEEVGAMITVGFIKRVKELSASGKYDAIVSSAGIDPGFYAAGMLSKIPIVFTVHAAVHVASLIGKRTSLIFLNDAQALVNRHSIQLYGFNDKVISIRPIHRSSPYVLRLLRDHKKEKRADVPEVLQVIDEMMEQCKKAILEDRVDSLILVPPHLQCFEPELRRSLDRSGYSEVPLILGLSAAIEMAIAMVHMKLRPAPRAYPSDSLMAKPEFR